LKIVDPLNPIPKYLQISAWLKELIQTGRYKKGEQLPSEIELAKMCEVNRNTLRQAIAELANQGLLRKEKGLGTFVTSPAAISLKHKLKQISSFRDDLSQIGVKEKTRLLKSAIEKAPAPVAKTLLLGAGTKVVTTHRLRTGDGLPLIYEESFLPSHTFKNILNMDLTDSMYKIITSHFNIVLARSEQSIRAVNLNQKIAGFLNLPVNTAGIFMESITFDEDNIPVEVLYSYYRGDKYVFEIEVGKYHLEENGNELYHDHG